MPGQAPAAGGFPKTCLRLPCPSRNCPHSWVASGRLLPSLAMDRHFLSRGGPQPHLSCESPAFPQIRWGNRGSERRRKPLEAARQATGTAPWSAVSAESAAPPKALVLPPPPQRQRRSACPSCVMSGGFISTGCKLGPEGGGQGSRGSFTAREGPRARSRERCGVDHRAAQGRPKDIQPETGGARAWPGVA